MAGILTTAAVASKRKIANFLAFSPPSSSTLFSTLAPYMLSLCASKKPTPSITLNTHQKRPSYLNRKRNALFLTDCSVKPDASTNNPPNQNPVPEIDSASNTEEKPATDTSVQNVSSSSSSSSLSCSNGLLFDLGSTNSWDRLEIGSPVVKRYLSDDEERWFMWYHARSENNQGSDSIGLAVSGNGIDWERGAGPVLNCSNDWWAFDTQSVRPSDVVIMSSSKIRGSNSVYWLYYSGFSHEKIDLSYNNKGIMCFNANGDIFKSLPGLAMSQDGRHWARIEGDHHSGALFDVGSDKEWDSQFIAAPHVVFHSKNDLRMYYHSFDVKKQELSIGIARSRDGIKWVKLGMIMGGGAMGDFDEFGVSNANVVRNRKDASYLMAYEGVDANGMSSIGLATSLDGLKEWRKLGNGAIIKVEDRKWDEEGVGSPCLVHMEGDEDEWRLYYRGIGNGGKTGIGMAVCEGDDITRFRKWRGFNL